MSSILRPDLCVIGGGSGGLSVAAGAAQMGASVVLVEGHRMGGDCLNYGCIPSKSLIAAARSAQAMRSGAGFGVAAVEPSIDFAATKEHVARVIASIAPHDSVERFEKLGVRVIQDWARFVSPRRMEAGGAAIEARRFVIATGSRPIVPPVPGLRQTRHFTNEDIFELRERPRHLVILGGGPIGIEMAQAHRRLGSEVTVIEAARILSREDRDLAAVVAARLRAEGVRLIEGVRAQAVAPGGDGVTVEIASAEAPEGAGVEEVVAGSHLLVAVGREPSLDRLDLAAGGVSSTKSGVSVDAGLRSVSNRRVYAIADACGEMRFTHLAGYHAGLVIRNALFALPIRVRTNHIPRVTYADPELAQVGATEAEARQAHGDRIEVLRSDYAENDRARADGRTEGFAKVIVLKGRPIGAGIVGERAGELIALWSLAIESGTKIGRIAGMVAPYPTLSEISKRTAGQYFVPRLFGSTKVRRLVRLVQSWMP